MQPGITLIEKGSVEKNVFFFCWNILNVYKYIYYNFIDHRKGLEYLYMVSQLVDRFRCKTINPEWVGSIPEVYKIFSRRFDSIVALFLHERNVVVPLSFFFLIFSKLLFITALVELLLFYCFDHPPHSVPQFAQSKKIKCRALCRAHL